MRMFNGIETLFSLTGGGDSPRDNEVSIEHRCDDRWRTKTLLDGTFEWSPFEEPPVRIELTTARLEGGSAYVRGCSLQ
jgi:hypothetical protein